MTEGYKPNVEDAEKNEALMRVHLRGILGNLQTIKGWGGHKNNERQQTWQEPNRTLQQIKLDQKSLGRSYHQTFDNPKVGPVAGALLKRLEDIFLTPEPVISPKTYNDLIAQWEHVLKHIGK
jgi:hypothetical protein